MPHPLEVEYGLSAEELLDAIGSRFRAEVTLEGAVAEIHMEKHIARLVGSVIERYEVHDVDGYPDFSIWIPGREERLLAECKNVRDHREAYRRGGEVVAYKVETQKTRAATSDATSRYYDVDRFDILGVCLGKKTGNWAEFAFARTIDLKRHAAHPAKLAVMQRVPLPGGVDRSGWFDDLGELLKTLG